MQIVGFPMGRLIYSLLSVILPHVFSILFIVSFTGGARVDMPEVNGIAIDAGMLGTVGAPGTSFIT